MTAARRTVTVALSIAIAGTLLFIVAYVAGGDRRWEGTGIALCAAGFCAALLVAARRLCAPQTVVDEVPIFAAESAELPRSTALARLAYAALAFAGLGALVPVFSLGPAPGDALFHTKWRRGLRVMREDGTPVRASDLDVDSAVTVFPEGAVGDAQSQAMLVRLPSSLAPGTQGFAAYSKICTHAGCPVAIYRARARQLMCPCHQSVFDAATDGSVVSGPADRALPRLILTIDGEGFVRANGDFSGPVGPGTWEES